MISVFHTNLPQFSLWLYWHLHSFLFRLSMPPIRAAFQLVAKVCFFKKSACSQSLSPNPFPRERGYITGATAPRPCRGLRPCDPIFRKYKGLSTDRNRSCYGAVDYLHIIPMLWYRRMLRRRFHYRLYCRLKKRKHRTMFFLPW